jgi:hypothetical protein
MKKFILSFTICFFFFASFAQSEKYVKNMQDKVGAVDTTRTPDALIELSAAFERIADAEKTQWLPYYYAAYTQINSGYMMSGGQTGTNMTEKFDPIAEKAEQLLNKAEALNNDNSEIFVVKKMIASLRMMADPMSRYMQYGPVAQQALATAKKLNPENPRPYLLEAQDKYFTPEQYGGSKTKAKEFFEEALKKYEAFKPASNLDPVWGKTTAQYFLSLIKQ